MIRQLLACSLLAFSALLSAAAPTPLQEANFPSRLHDGAQIMERQSQIVLTYLWADIYALALFTEPGVSPQQAIDQHRDLRLELFYLRDLAHSDVLKVSASTLERQQNTATLARLQPSLNALESSFGNIQRGDRYALDYDPRRGLNLEHNGKVIFSSPDPELAKVYLGIWLSPDGLPEKLRQNLLSKTR